MTADARFTRPASPRDGRDLGQRIRASNGPERVDACMQAESPGGAVAVSREEVAPILRHEPEPGADRGGRDEAVIHAVEERPEAEPE